jgi:hypothetical protein
MVGAVDCILIGYQSTIKQPGGAMAAAGGAFLAFRSSRHQTSSFVFVFSVHLALPPAESIFSIVPAIPGFQLRIRFPRICRGKRRRALDIRVTTVPGVAFPVPHAFRRA